MTRIVSGVLLAAAALAAILLLPFAALRIVACVVAGVAADEYVRITGARPERPERVERQSVSRWIVIAMVVYTCWWAAVPAPLSIVLLAILVIFWQIGSGNV